MAQLIEAGFAYTVKGAGTYVAESAPRVLAGDDELVFGLQASPPAQLSHRGEGLTVGIPLLAQPDAPRPFDVGPAVDASLIHTWSQLLVRAGKRYHDDGRNLATHRDVPALRDQICQYLSTTRGVVCHPDQVVLVNSAASGLDLAVRLLTDPGDHAWLEDPGDPKVRTICAAAGLHLHPAPVGAGGMSAEASASLLPAARIVLVSPACQFPLGTSMSNPRRTELLAWARETRSWIIESDTGGVRTSSARLPALKAMDDTGRVVYIGDFDGILDPVLHLAYLVIPRALSGRFRRALELGYGPGATVGLTVLAHYLREGYLARYSARLRRLHEERLDVLTRALDSMALWIRPDLLVGQFHVVARMVDGLDDAAVAGIAERVDISVVRLSPLYMENPRQGLLLGFAAHTCDALQEGAQAFQHAMASWMAQPSSRRIRSDFTVRTN